MEVKEQGNVTISSKCQNLIPQCNSYHPAEREAAGRRCLQVGFAKEEFKEFNISVEDNSDFGVLWVFSLVYLLRFYFPLFASQLFDQIF